MNEDSGSPPTAAVSSADAPPAGAPEDAAPRTPILPAEWATKAADSVELAVALVSDRAVRPVVVAARVVVFGVLIAALAVAVLIWGSVGFVRLLDVYAWPGEVWASYLLLGGLFTVLGSLAWWYAHRQAPTATS